MIFMELFYFISEYNKSEILTLNKEVNIIYRNYKRPPNEDTLKEILHTCRKANRKLFLSNNMRLALKLKLDGVYLPSFNKSKYLRINYNADFRIIVPKKTRLHLIWPNDRDDK